MRLGGQVDHPVDRVIGKEFFQEWGIDNITFDKTIIGEVLDILQVLQVSGIGKLIQVDNLIFRVVKNYFSNHMRSDKTGTAGDQDGFHHGTIFCLMCFSQFQADRRVSPIPFSAFHPSSSLA